MALNSPSQIFNHILYFNQANRLETLYLSRSLRSVANKKKPSFTTGLFLNNQPNFKWWKTNT